MLEVMCRYNEMSKRKERFSPFLKQCFVTAAVCCNTVGHGCTLGYPGILLPQLRRPDSPLTLSKAAESWIAAVSGIMLLVGSLVTPPIMSRRGRKVAHIALCVPGVLGWLMTVLSSGFEMLFISRVLQGLSYGMLSPLRSVLVGEYTSPKLRGAFLTLIALAQAFGIFFVHLLGSVCDWQVTALVCMFFPFISLVMAINAPESPSWLASTGRYDKCRKVFRWLRGYDEDDELEEMIQIRKKVAVVKRDKQNVIEEAVKTLKKKEFYKPNVIMIHALCMIHFAGGTTMASYSPIILKLIVGDVDVQFWMIALDSLRIVWNTIAVFVINKVNRRTMTMVTGGICVLSHLAISGYVISKNRSWFAYDAQWIPLLLINVQFFSVAVGMVPLPSIFAGEVYPLQYRDIGGFISNCSLSGFMFLALKTFPALTDSIGIEGTYLVYAGALAYTLAVVLWLLPETRGRTLQQIEDEFRGHRLDEDKSRLELEKIKLDHF